MASTGEAVRLRRPALDGLRGIAVLLVLVAHAHLPGANTFGVAGVTVFFVLSGFLITSLMVEDHSEHGAVRLGRFYRRRVLRLFPALAACILTIALVGLIVPGFVEPGGLLVASLQMSNWAMVLLPSHFIGALSHTWSLATEEQFYLMWPLLFSAIAHRRRLALAVTAAGLATSVVERCLLWHRGAGEFRIAFGADTHADALLAGCLLALLVAGRTVPQARPRTAVVLVACIGVIGFVPGQTSHLIVPSIVVAATIMVITFSIGGCQLLEWPLLRLVGERSYGLYLWHYPVSILVTMRFHDAWVPELLLMVPAAVVLTALSWRYVEEPFLRRRTGRDWSEQPWFSPHPMGTQSPS